MRQLSVTWVLEMVAGVGGLYQDVVQVPVIGQSVSQCVHHCVEDGH